MSQQNQRIDTSRSGSSPKILGSSTTLISRKISQLQNKAFFFQGQLNPIILQNEKLKVQLTSLNKKVISSTDMLRALITIGTDNNLRLKLQLANIQQISQMIRQNWHEMQDTISKKIFTIDVLEKKLVSNKQKYQNEFEVFKQITEREFLQKQQKLKIKKQKIQFFEKQLNNTILKSKKDIQEIHEKYKMRIQRAQKLQVGFQLYKKQVKQKYRIYDKSIQKLNEQIKNHLDRFQDAKKNLREIYDQLMQDKLVEQSQNFQFLLKTKQQQKDRLMSYFQQKQNELVKQIKNKCNHIQKLHHTINDKNNEIKQREQTIQIKSDKIVQLYNLSESKNKQILDLTTKNQQIQQKLSVIQGQFQLKENQYLRQISEQNQIYSQTQKQLNLKLNNLTKQKENLQDELSQKSYKLKSVQKKLATVERKCNQMIQEQRQKLRLEKHQMNKKNLEIEQKLKLRNQQFKKLSDNFHQQQKKSRLKLEQLEKNKLKQLQQMKKIHRSILENFSQQNSLFIASLKQQYQKALAQQRELNNKQIQKMVILHNDSMRLKQIQFNRIKQNLEEQVKKKTTELLQNRQRLQSIQSKLNEAERNISQMKQSYSSQLHRLKLQNEQKIKNILSQSQEQKKKLQKQMLNQLLEFQMQMQKKQTQYKNQINKIKTEMMDQIKLLKSNNALEQFQKKLLEQMQKLKRQHQYQLSQMQQKQKQSQNSLIEEQNRKIQQLIRQYEEDMTKLAKRLQNDISKLNDQLLNEQTDHQITKMSREEKIQYLCKRIQELRGISESKDIKILQLQMQIQYLQSQLDKIQQIVQQKVRERKNELEKQKMQLERNCQQIIDKIRAQTNKKVNEIEKQRLQNTHQLYNKFNEMKQLHEHELSRLEKKYYQLQRIFAQRPSRAQDVSKIKQLISMKQKFEIQIQTYQKKAEQANQIVKYLNLELQNYKDNYDMFGPNEQNQGKTVTVQATTTVQYQPKNNIRRKKIIQKLNTEGSDYLFNNNRYQITSPKLNINKRLFSQSSDTKEILQFPSINVNQSTLMFSQPELPADQRKMSNLRNPDLINKALKSRSVSNQIVLNAQNFLSLIRNNPKPPIKQQRLKSHQKGSYRKLKPRKLNALGVGAGQSYHL